MNNPEKNYGILVGILSLFGKCCPITFSKKATNCQAKQELQNVTDSPAKDSSRSQYSSPSRDESSSDRTQSLSSAQGEHARQRRGLRSRKNQALGVEPSSPEVSLLSRLKTSRSIASPREYQDKPSKQYQKAASLDTWQSVKNKSKAYPREDEMSKRPQSYNHLTNLSESTRRDMIQGTPGKRTKMHSFITKLVEVEENCTSRYKANTSVAGLHASVSRKKSANWKKGATAISAYNAITKQHTRPTK